MKTAPYWLLLPLFLVFSSNLGAQDSLKVVESLKHASDLVERDLDSCLVLAEKVLEQAGRGDFLTLEFKAKLLKGKAFYYMHRYEAALQELLSAGEIELPEQAERHHFISKIHRHQKNYRESISHSRLALQWGRRYQDMDAIQQAFAGMANTYGSMEQPDSSRKYLFLQAAVVRQMEDSTQLIGIYANLAVLHKEQGRLDSSEKFIGLALDMLASDSVRLASSRNFRRMRANMFYEKGHVAFLRGQNQDALNWVGKAYAMLAAEQDVRGLARVTRLRSEIAVELGEYRSALAFFQEHAAWKDSLVRLENSEKFAEMETAYQTEQKEEKIRAQGLLLAEEKKANFWLSVAVGFIVLTALVGGLFLRQGHKARTEALLQQQREIALGKVLEAEERERARIAKDLHDGVVQDLTAIRHKMMQLQKDRPDKVEVVLESLHDDLLRTAKEVRELSYQMMPVTLQQIGLVRALEDLMERAFGPVGLQFELDCLGIDKRLPEKIEVSVYRICQELINNTLKHSKAGHVVLLLIRKGDFLSLTYEDDGVGFDPVTAARGVGLNSLTNRVESLKGSLRFDSSAGKGTTAFIRIPVS